MLLLALDTSTPAVTVAVAAGDRVLAERCEVAANRHGELLTPLVAEALDEAGASVGDIEAVAVGLGPGPFTGLRVGIVTVAALADAWQVPAYGACSLDVVAFRHAGRGAPYVVVTDARRRQVYWARYDGSGRRLEGPDLAPPADVVASLHAGERVVGAGLLAHAEAFVGYPTDGEAAYPAAGALARLVAGRAAAGEAGDDLSPLYLRRPDAKPPGPSKRVTPA